MPFERWPEYLHAPELGALVAPIPTLRGPFRRIVRDLHVTTVEGLRHIVTHAPGELLELNNVGERSLVRLREVLEAVPVPVTSSRILTHPDVGEPGLAVDPETGTFHGTLVRYCDMEEATELFVTREQIEQAPLYYFTCQEVELDNGETASVGVLGPTRGARIVMSRQGELPGEFGPLEAVEAGWRAGRLGVLTVQQQEQGVTVSGQFDRGHDLGRVLLSALACAWWSPSPQTMMKNTAQGGVSTWERAHPDYPAYLGAVVLTPRRINPGKIENTAA